MSEPGGGAVGEAPNMGAAIRGLPQGGLTLKKKVLPKADPKKLKVNAGWKKSFSKFSSRMGGKRGA